MGYKERIAAGLCGLCGDKPEQGKLCDKCRKKAKTKAAEKRDKRRDAGQCLDCTQPAEPGKTRCKTHAKRQSDYRASQVADWKAAGLCQHCGTEPKPGTTLCQVCIDKLTATASKRYYDNKEQGVCPYCGEPAADGVITCERHREYYNGYRRQLKTDALDAYGGRKCARCPEDDVAILEIDHIDGGGRQHRIAINRLGGLEFYHWLKQQSYPPGFQVLCPNCNKRKHATRKTVT